MLEYQRINWILEKRFGKELTGEPRFRISWSDSQIEKRLGTYNIYSGPIFLRTETGVREVPKYPYIKERFVLERLIYHSNPELPASRISYEPLYVFEDSKCESLPLSEKVAIIVCSLCLNPVTNALQRQRLFEELEEKELQKEIAYFEDVLDEGYLASRLHDRDGIIINPLEKGGVND